MQTERLRGVVAALIWIALQSVRLESQVLLQRAPQLLWLLGFGCRQLE